MAQISRPFQIALAAVGVLAAVWFFALRGHSSGSSSSGGSPQAQPQPAPPAAQPGAARPIYHGSAPGVEGLTRAIAKAHGAVAASEHNAQSVQEQSARASSSAPATSGATTTASRPAPSPAASSHAAVSATVATSGAHGPHPSARRSSVPVVNPKQAAIEGELKRGKVAAILLWSANGSIDAVVRRELQAAGHALGGSVVVYEAHPSQVASFGSFTSAVPVYATPTILIVNRHGHTTTVSGLTDAFSIEQAIGEARSS
jgi:cobalamin biosynthesis Mg chelatase CobN